MTKSMPVLSAAVDRTSFGQRAGKSARKRICAAILLPLALAACVPEDEDTARNGAIGAILGAKVAQMVAGEDATFIGALLGGLLGSAVPEEALCDEEAGDDCAAEAG